MSGPPIFTEDGNVIGVVAASSGQSDPDEPDQEGSSFVIMHYLPVWLLREFQFPRPICPRCGLNGYHQDRGSCAQALRARAAEFEA